MNREKSVNISAQTLRQKLESVSINADTLGTGGKKY